MACQLQMEKESLGRDARRHAAVGSTTPGHVVGRDFGRLEVGNGGKVGGIAGEKPCTVVPRADLSLDRPKGQ